MSVMQHVRVNLARGLLLALPMIITLWLLKVLFGLVSGNVTPWLLAILRLAGLREPEAWSARVTVPLIGVVLTLVLIYLLGVLGANLLGRRLLEAIERGILRIPLVRSIYGSSRQLLDALNPRSKGAFSRVVLVEYPRRGVWTVGFVTNEVTTLLPAPEGAEDTVTVFFPTTPNPTSGWLAFVPVREIIGLDLTIEEGVKLIMSGGIVTPDAFAGRVREPAPGPTRP
jgi:uncharacterized membrane protein